MLCPADGLDAFRARAARSLTGRVVFSRTVALEEAADRYRSTRDVLPLCARAEPGERVIDARRLLWHRMLANQRAELVGDYVDEVLGPVLRLPEGRRAPLPETLEALDRHGGSVGAAAADLVVHEKTIRYRLRRVETLTGLNALTRNRRVNRTNSTAVIGEDGTLTDALARRDVLRLRHAVVTAAADAAGGRDQRGMVRQLRSELKMLAALPVAALRAQADDLAREIRETDVRIQRANWEVDLLD